MHKIPLTQIEEDGLRAHGLDIGTPSQLSDVFRQGIAWAKSQQAPSAVPEGWVAIHLKTGNEYMVTGESIHAGNVPAVPGETMVEYQRDGKRYVRAAGEFQEKFAAAPKERK